MPQQELLTRVIEALDRIGIDHMITGSVASSLQGEPRSTHDVDVVVAIQGADVARLVEAFPPPRYHLDAESMREAIAHQSMFNWIEVAEGDKVDFWILTEGAFDRSRFSRKCEEEVLGMRLRVSSPEDTILAKLQWAVMSGGSEKQFTDALRIFEVQQGHLDLDYLEEWVNELAVERIWKRLQAEADCPD